MQILYVHGMGRTPLSGYGMLSKFRQANFTVETFWYFVTFEDFSSIKERLKKKLIKLGEKGDYVVIGHSLGGVLLRAALCELTHIKMPKHLFLLGAPVTEARLALRLKDNLLYKIITQDCGQLLASPQRMAAIDFPDIPVTAIIGNRNFFLTQSFFKDEINDGVVAEKETVTDKMTYLYQVPILHSWLPGKKEIGELILQSLHSSAY